MQIKRIIPNSLTCANLLCGSAAVFMATQEEFLWAFVLILAGGLFDFFDGASARWLKVPSPLGVQLDSLADDITFGLAPSMALMCFLKPIIGWWSLIALLMAAFSALRLAKFNIDERQTTSFIGLATPPNAILWASVAAYPHTQTTPTFAWIMVGLSLLCCYLLVCEIPFFSFKSVGKHRTRIIIFIVGCIVLIAGSIAWAVICQDPKKAVVAGALCILWYINYNFIIQTLLHK
ncbi:MAG: CDP-alcohol phosphatidyltransferase family protein [Paludibacteraceae bacterium]|nr:CDP-alcohol phosphatidyltransferase family protein [Paludibacteraceae bacterium]